MNSPGINGAVQKILYNLNNFTWPSIGTNSTGFSWIKWTLGFSSLSNDFGTGFFLDFWTGFQDLDALVFWILVLLFPRSFNREYKHRAMLKQRQAH